MMWHPLPLRGILQEVARPQGDDGFVGLPGGMPYAGFWEQGTISGVAGEKRHVSDAVHHSDSYESIFCQPSGMGPLSECR